MSRPNGLTAGGKLSSWFMTAFDTAEEFTVTAHVTMVYQGPVAPHWELETHFGDQKMVDAFWTRVYARLLLLPKHDPQFRRNRERVNRDAEREGIVCDWDLGEGDAETTKTDVVNPADAVVEEPDVEGGETYDAEHVASLDEAPATEEEHGNDGAGLVEEEVTAGQSDVEAVEEAISSDEEE